MHLGKLILDNRCSNLSSPSRYIGIFGYHQMYITVKTGTRIPTGRFILVFQAYGQFIDFTSFYIRSNIEVERVIAIRPISCFLTIDIHTGMTHGTIENQCSFLSFCKRRSFEIEAIPAYSYERKTTGTTGMFHRFLLSVLCNGYILSIVVDTERSVDGPIVRYGYTLPFGIVITNLRKLHLVFASELPSFFKESFGADLCLKHGSYAQSTYHSKELFHKAIN